MGSVKLSAGHWKSLWRDKWKAHTCSKRQVGQCGERVNIWFGGDTEQAKQILLFCNYVLRSGASFLCRGRAGFGSARTLPCINDSLGSGCSAQHISPAGESESWGFWFGVIWRVKTRHPPPAAAPSSSLQVGQLGRGSLSCEVLGFFFFPLARKIWYLHLVEEVRREGNLFSHVGLRISCAALPWGATLLSCFVRSFVTIVEYWHLSMYWVLIH